MNVVNQIYPTAEQLMALAQNPSPEAIAMVNLLKFRERAEYPDGDHGLSGREAFMRYATAMRRIVEGAGGRFLFSGDVGGLVLGQVDELWDAVGIVQYPSRQVFQQLATSPEVAEIGVDRTAGLAGQLLILTVAQNLDDIR